ncbi:hypothetical protein M404DRAFT_991537 [Pisolithus tinctorius Marx 270]|uniref:Uncharacterized protein n=1 Tax=Pisolithus tinctorius Marx 270 TaxID=870435 RepID=A0A0C3PYM4_PISTI|nr:hypothetical protein M404DRAFT_991537 [Pisolithus tinctorius Marx 270]
MLEFTAVQRAAITIRRKPVRQDSMADEDEGITPSHGNSEGPTTIEKEGANVSNMYIDV